LNGRDVHAAEALLEEAADGRVDHDVLAVLLWICGKPARLPVADDAEAMCVWMDGVGHTYFAAFLADFFFAAFAGFASLAMSSSMFTCDIVRRMPAARPRAIGLKRRITFALSTEILLTTKSSGFMPCVRAFAIAELRSLMISGDDFFARKTSESRA